MSDSEYLKYFLYASFIVGALFVWDTLWGPGGERYMQKAISSGQYYVTKCKPIEINIDTGFFSLNKNKLNCNGVITNITTDEYDRSVKAYNDSLQKLSSN